MRRNHKNNILAASLTQYQSQYFAWLLSRRMGADSADMLASTLVDAQVDLNPHQVEAALFAFQSPLSKGVILADEVGLGKTIEAGLVIAQRWAERKRRILIVVPANMRKQWHQELQDKFSLHALILEARNYKQLQKEGNKNPFAQSNRVVICSYQFAKAKADDLKLVPWDLAVMDEAHRLRNVYKPSNVIGKALKEALAHAPKVLLTATPLQNSLLELYGLVSFIDHSNPADKRVYELLAQKFQLFEGVFGASDEVLGTIGSGVDFERRIAEIYQTCRNPQEIETSFQQLQMDLFDEINTAMLKTRQLLLENFDEAVQQKLKSRQSESLSSRNRFERLLMDLTRAELEGHASFDETGFTLERTPAGVLPDDAPPGRYELPRRSGEAHLYRTGDPLAQALIAQARDCRLPVAKLHFSYDSYGTKVSTLEALRGQSGWLVFSILSIEALGTVEDYVLLAGTTDAGEPLHEEDPEKLLRLPAELLPARVHELREPGALEHALKEQENQRIREVNQRNLGYFEAEVQKLDAWADDLKSGLENEVKELDREIKDVRRTAAVAATLEEKLRHQKRQRELEEKRGQLRRRIFDRQDEIDAQRNRLIGDLESRLTRRLKTAEVFAVQWSLQ
jgi:hypothetical protein